MDSIITFIVIIIMVVSIVSKLKAKPKQGKAPARGGGLIDKLNAFLEQAQKNLEQQNRQNREASYEWDQLMEEEEPEQQVYYERDALEDLIIEEEPPPPPRIPPREPRRARLERERKERPAAATMKTPPPARRGQQRKGIHMGRRQLRKAIIWSEIIGPPVGLRNSSNNRF